MLQESRNILAGYGALSDSTLGDGLLTFSVPTDVVDEDFYAWAIGFSTVLRGGRQSSLDGPVSGGLMGYIQYEVVEELDNYEQTIVSGGFRYEF
jgi:hypothetical protein